MSAKKQKRPSIRTNQLPAAMVRAKSKSASVAWALLLLGAAVLGAFSIKKLSEQQPENQAGTGRTSTSSASKASNGSSEAPGIVRPTEEPPWQAAQHRSEAQLPVGAVPASEINPPPPDPNSPPPPAPTEPPNPATHRPLEGS